MSFLILERSGSMQKFFLMILMILVSAMSVSAAEDRTGKTDLNFQIGGLLSTNSHSDNGAYYGGRVTYNFKDWFAVGLEGGYSDTTTRFTIDPTEYRSHISYIPLFFDLMFKYTQNQDYNYVPYGVLGLGMLFTDVHGTGTLNDSNFKMDINNSFAIKLGAGIDWFVNSNWALNFEASYVWAAADANLVNLTSGTAVDSASMDYWTLLGGLKYLFD